MTLLDFDCALLALSITLCLAPCNRICCYAPYSRAIFTVFLAQFAIRCGPLTVSILHLIRANLSLFLSEFLISFLFAGINLRAFALPPLSPELPFGPLHLASPPSAPSAPAPQRRSFPSLPAP